MAAHSATRENLRYGVPGATSNTGPVAQAINETAAAATPALSPNGKSRSSALAPSRKAAINAHPRSKKAIASRCFTIFGSSWLSDGTELRHEATSARMNCRMYWVGSGLPSLPQPDAHQPAKCCRSRRISETTCALASSTCMASTFM